VGAGGFDEKGLLHVPRAKWLTMISRRDNGTPHRDELSFQRCLKSMLN
jgi:hypothetical protein